MARMTKAMASAFENRVSNELAAQRNLCNDLLQETVKELVVHYSKQVAEVEKEIRELKETVKTLLEERMTRVEVINIEPVDAATRD